MGVFTKSIFVLLVAISMPLLYRQFANENTIKFMSSYYSDYKTIDSFLRQSANHLDRASSKVKSEINNLAIKVQEQIKAYSGDKTINSKEKAGHNNKKSSSEKKVVEQPTYRLSSCAGEKEPVRLWTSDELAEFDGSSGPSDIYIGFLGLVYNVSSSAKHYGPGSEYSVFAGRDATRAFVTGNFTHDLHDNIKDIEESMYNHIEAWASFYSSSYPVVGRIIGSFYDTKGCGTGELARVIDVFHRLAEIRQAKSRQETGLPECNSEWNGDTKKGRVWCTKKSGGVEREWAGVPRIYVDKDESQSCVCLNPEGSISKELELRLRSYPDCSSQANECDISHQ